ncbi:hypothetical protein HDU76_010168 [Blyttiomyces sp. JEL0837]|nr:hypothetical protein HDU76_010168 [Blyttiomyces sp. JEL0837]
MSTSDYPQSSSRYPPGQSSPLRTLFNRTNGSNKEAATGIRTTLTRRHLYIAIGVTLAIVVAIALAVGLTVGKKNNTAAGSDIQNSFRPTLLICFDGVRPDYITKDTTPVIYDFMQNAKVTGKTVPVFPAQSFPNQYAMMTGLYPYKHGIVGDYFHAKDVNADRPVSYGRNTTETVNTGGFYFGRPFWSVVKSKLGGISGTVNWPGSEASVNNDPPTLEQNYNSTQADSFRISKVVEWLSQNNSNVRIPKVPDFIATHLRLLDVTGVANGTKDASITKALTTLDTNFKTLLDGLAKNQLSVDNNYNIIVVSDHGMADVPRPTDANNNLIHYEDILNDIDNTNIVQNRPMGYVYVKEGVDPSSVLKTIPADAKYTLYVQGSDKYKFPDTYQPDKNGRVPSILILPNEGYYLQFSSPGRLFAPNVLGAAGYDPTLPSMAGIFMAAGPAFKKADSQVTVKSIDVYPLLVSVVNAPLDTGAAVDGQLGDLAKWIV